MATHFGFIGNLGTVEMIVIILVLIVVVGPGKLPDVARKAGRRIRDIRRTGDDIRSKIETEIYADEDGEGEYVDFQRKASALDEPAEIGEGAAGAEAAGEDERGQGADRDPVGGGDGTQK